MAHLEQHNDIKNKKRYIKRQRKKNNPSTEETDDEEKFDEIDNAFDEDYQLENDDFGLDDEKEISDKQAEKEEKNLLRDDLENLNLFDSHTSDFKNNTERLNQNKDNYTQRDLKPPRRENKSQFKQSAKDLKAKIKKEGKNKSGMLKMVIGMFIFLSIVTPLIVWVAITSATVGAGAAVAGALVDPKQRAELKAKNEIGDSEVTKVPKEILGAEFKDADVDKANDSDKANAKSTDNKDSGNNLDAQGVGGIRKKIIDLAQSQVDKKVPYVWGGTSWDTGMDCSGFVQQTFKKVGIDLPRTSEQQAPFCKKIDKKDAKPGDLIFFDEHGDVGHVAIYAGNDELFEEPQPGQTCHKIKIYNMPGATTFYARPPALDKDN